MKCVWVVFRLLSLFCLALVNYLDEYLTTKISSQVEPNIHKRVGSLLVATTVFSFIGLSFLWFFIEDLSSIDSSGKWLALLSAIPAVLTFIGYFYSLNKFSVHLVSPLFLLTTVWLVIFEFANGQTVSLGALVAMATILVGSYFLDIGEFSFRVPTKLVLYMAPTTLAWAATILMVKEALGTMSSTTAYFIQLIGVQIIGILLVIFIKQYREGFTQRVSKDGKMFLGLSFLNESLAQLSYLFGTLAIAAAPFVSYVSALEGLQSIFVIGLLFLFPINERSKINLIQMAAICLIVSGAVAITIL